MQMWIVTHLNWFATFALGGMSVYAVSEYFEIHFGLRKEKGWRKYKRLIASLLALLCLIGFFGMLYLERSRRWGF